MSSSVHLAGLEEISRRTLDHIAREDDAILPLLHDALASERACAARYKRHYFLAQALGRRDVAQELAALADEEERHVAVLVHQIALRGDVASGGSALFSYEYPGPPCLVTYLREDLAAQRITIDAYARTMAYLADRDAEASRVFADLLEREYEHERRLMALVDRA
jgi:bacterioferritin